MRRQFQQGDTVVRAGIDWGGLRQGEKYVVTFVEPSGRLVLDGHEGRTWDPLNFVPWTDPKGPFWSDVSERDTVTFDADGTTVMAKVKGSRGNLSVLGWSIGSIDSIWKLLSIKKANPPIPTDFGARVMYQDKQWALLYASMFPALTSTKHRRVWVEINEDRFNWVGHEDIDREEFEVLFEGWKTA